MFRGCTIFILNIENERYGEWGKTVGDDLFITQRDEGGEANIVEYIIHDLKVQALLAASIVRISSGYGVSTLNVKGGESREPYHCWGAKATALRWPLLP